jgi:hypothetical protein
VFYCGRVYRRGEARRESALTKNQRVKRRRRRVASAGKREEKVAERFIRTKFYFYSRRESGR